MNKFGMTKEEMHIAYNLGLMMVEQRHDTWTFKLLWMHYSNNHNRKVRYDFNYPTWVPQYISLFDKIRLILDGTMKRVKDV